MTAPARLLGLRLQGFKSFAERTVVEFGGGISAVVGPNGSGKSNLADALRWALGEQGRSLRTRKSEDVIFAGSDRRAAIGMADVTIILDNADGLLPVDYSVLELGRRLYRSGENEYLLNKQRVRLRDLVDLLDAAHLADNAFLFIGQGMVDQALALRPEERRPLFEEVAGVRRHERRRRKAEEQLVEAEANLARVLDIVAELRPQARRLAAQAEQQTTRSSAGEELVAALITAAHARWHEASAQAVGAGARLARTRADADAAMTALKEAESAASGVAAALGVRAAAEAESRATHDAARSALSGLELRGARLGADLEATARDRTRLEAERAAAEADVATQRRLMAEPVPPRDVDAEATLAEAERALADALAELGGLRASRAARGDEAAAIRRAEAARETELETARRRATDATQRATAEARLAATSAAALGEAETHLDGVRTALAASTTAEAAAAVARDGARGDLERAEAGRQAALERASATGSRLAQLSGRLEALRARLVEDETRPIARAARKVGGRRVDADLGLDPAFRAAVDLALGDAARGYLVDRSAIAGLAGERGTLVAADGDTGEASGAVGAAGRERAFGAADRAVLDRVAAVGGGRLADGIRRDPSGAATRLLERVCWVPDLAALVEVQRFLAVGWLAVVRDGSAAAGPVAIALGRGDGSLERQADVERLATELGDATAEDAAARQGAADAGTAVDEARRRLEAVRNDEARMAAARRAAEEAERTAGRSLEAVAREAGWHAAQAERLGAEAGRVTAAVTELEALRPATAASGDADAGSSAPADDVAALATWETRATELRGRRDRLAMEAAERDTVRRQHEARRARAEAAIAMDDERIDRVAGELAGLAERERALRAERATLTTELATAAERETRARAALDEQRAADVVDRDRLAAAEQAAGSARERLRSADDRARTAEVSDLEARLGLESVREGLMVELAGLGDLALRALGVEPAPVEIPALTTLDAATGIDAEAAPGPGSDDALADDSVTLARALAAIGEHWAAEAPRADVPPPGRLAHLRRRYHELGAANPFAVEEYAEVRTRLEGLEVQERDLRAAITDTRRLIEELATMIAEQFRTTFRALESAFDTRFQQLFGGGYARLSLTDPADLAATGVEIVARPPGKKAQALAMLSGGERALTAVALLFAMLEVRPVPFCVLDEVDAALDEANVGRFADALRSLADQTQFIVITHNRGTIEAADALYGVTVGDDSVSRVISLHLDEATALAERAGGERRGAGDSDSAMPIDVLA